MIEEMYCSREAATVLGIHVKTVARWARMGKLPGAIMPARSRRIGWRIPASLIDVLAAGGTMRSDGLLQLPLAATGGGAERDEQSG